MGPTRAPSRLPGVVMTTLAAVTFALVLSVTSAATVSDVITVENDVDCSAAALDHCLDIGQEFAERYLKKLNKGRLQHGACDRFEGFASCLQPILEHCPLARERLYHHGWHDVIRDMGCYCDPVQRPHCRASVTCLEEEFTNVMAQRCFAMHDFNIDQGTHGRCHFLQEKLSCMEALVTSSCDDATGHLAFVLLKIAHRSTITRRSCSVHRHRATSAFRYGADCPRDLTHQTAACSEMHLYDTEVTFMAENDLVAFAKKKVLKEACRNLREHKKCMHSLEQSCSRGVNQYYDFNGPLRTFLWKMNFICGSQKRAYLSNLQCYQSVVSQGLLSQCNLIWEQMKSALTAMTSHAFFCVHDDALVKQLKEDLDRLRMCYVAVFSEKCNRTAGDVMGNLIRRAFQDPLYLRLEFQADCDAHATTTTTASTSTSTTTTTTKYPLVTASVTSPSWGKVPSKPTSRMRTGGRTRELRRNSEELDPEYSGSQRDSTTTMRLAVAKPERVKTAAINSAAAGTQFRTTGSWILYICSFVAMVIVSRDNKLNVVTS